MRLEPGPKSPEQIMRDAGEALYVQSVSGLHSGTNPISGDFSVGAEGLMVRNGSFAEPVREITIASTLQRMLLDLTEVGSDLTFLPGSIAGMTVLDRGDDRQRLVSRRYWSSSCVELGEHRPRVAVEVHDTHAEFACGGDVVGVVVDEHGLLGRDAEPFARERVDLAIGFAHADVAGIDDVFAQLVDREHRPPVVAELLDVVRQQADAQPACLQLAHLVHDHPVHARCSGAPEAAVRVHVDRASEHLRRAFDNAVEVGRDVELALLEQVPVGLVFDFAFVLRGIGIGAERVGDGATLDADVVRLAEHQAEQRTARVALGFLERADADEERTRDHAAEVEDHGADGHQMTPVASNTIASTAIPIRYQPKIAIPCR